MRTNEKSNNSGFKALSDSEVNCVGGGRIIPIPPPIPPDAFLTYRLRRFIASLNNARRTTGPR